MLPLKRVLIATDCCPTAGHSLRYAVSFARRYQAELFVQHVVPDYFAKFPHWTTLFDVRQLQEHIHGYVAGELSAMIPASIRSELEVKEVLSRGHPAQEIVRFAQENGVDLIVIGTHDDEKAEAARLGSVAERVMRRAACPVLTVPPVSRDFVTAAEAGPPVELHRILFPTDFSDYSRRALEYALALSDEYRAELILLSVVEYDKAIHYEIERANLAHNKRAIWHWVENHLSQIVPPEYRKRIAWATRVVEGEPYEKILQVAEESPVDLIVMGAHGWSPVRQFFLGTTAEKVVRHAQHPVWTVKF